MEPWLFEHTRKQTHRQLAGRIETSGDEQRGANVSLVSESALRCARSTRQRAKTAVALLLLGAHVGSNCSQTVWQVRSEDVGGAALKPSDGTAAAIWRLR